MRRNGVAGTADGAERARILVVDDEESITQLVSTALRYEGFEVQTAGTGKAALREVEAFRPDLVLLRLMLPDLDGFEVQRRLPGRPDRLPVVFLTARRETEDRVRGLTIGADDYVTKPFSLEELIARVRAVLRRTRGDRGVDRRVTYADLELDEGHLRGAAGRDAHRAHSNGVQLLRYLMTNAGAFSVNRRSSITSGNYDFGGDANVVETYVSYLRRKLDGLGPPLIQTVRGVGYSLRQPRG